MYSDPECPLCPSNGEVDIVAETPVAYLAAALSPPVKESFLIVPRAHLTDFMELPLRWQISVGALLRSVPWYTPGSQYNLSLNQGAAAGQTLSHIHLWVIPRTDAEGSPTYGQGTASLLKRVSALVDYIHD